MTSQTITLNFNNIADHEDKNLLLIYDQNHDLYTITKDTVFHFLKDKHHTMIHMVKVSLDLDRSHTPHILTLSSLDTNTLTPFDYGIKEKTFIGTIIDNEFHKIMTHDRDNPNIIHQITQIGVSYDHDPNTSIHLFLSGRLPKDDFQILIESYTERKPIAITYHAYPLVHVNILIGAHIPEKSDL